MMEWIVSSSALILGVLALRALLRGKISLRLQYALWLLVLVRLLCPANFFQSSFSIQNAVDSMVHPPVFHSTVPENLYESPDGLPNANIPETPHNTPEEGRTEQNPVVSVPKPATVRQIDWTEVAIWVWIAGALLMLAFTWGCNFYFTRMIARDRREIPVPQASVPVYVSPWVKTPCLVGLFRPVIYLTSDVAQEPDTWDHVIRHEMTHLDHFDHLFSLLRCVALCVHWFNPLVWIAARASKEDCELACDEGTIARLGEGERIRYGETLIRLTCRSSHPSDLMIASTTMMGTKSAIRERVKLIAMRPRTLAVALVVCVVAVCVLVGCTFTGAVGEPETTEPEQTTEPVETTIPPETTLPVETTEPDPMIELQTQFESYLISQGFDITDEGLGYFGAVYSGTDSVIRFADVGLTLTIPEEWRDQVTITRDTQLYPSEYQFLVINNRLSEAFLGDHFYPGAYVVRIIAIQKMYSMAGNPRTDLHGPYTGNANYLGENNEFYFYYTTAEMSEGNVSPMFLKEFLVREHGEAFYEQLVGDLMVSSENFPDWVEIQDTPEEFLAPRPPLTLEDYPDFEWVGLRKNYRYTGNDPTIKFTEQGFTLHLPEEWMDRIDVILVTGFSEDFGVYIISRDMAELFARNGGASIYSEPRTTDYLLRIWIEDDEVLSDRGWILDSSEPNSILCATTRECHYKRENMPFLGARQMEMIIQIGQEEYDRAVGDLIITEEMLPQIIEVENGGEFTSYTEW